jgi:four helix bundle protein
MSIQSYRDLVAWQKAMDFAELVYTLTRRFPKEELYGLTLQVRKSAMSVPSNIAEGHGRRTARAFVSFLRVASGSLKEAETQLLLAHRLAYISDEDVGAAEQCATAVARPLAGLLRSLEKTMQSGKRAD